MVTLAAPCAIGAEKVLSNELIKLGFFPISQAPGRVVFSTANQDSGDQNYSVPMGQIPVAEDLAAIYRANLCIRTADRIYLVMASFPCRDFDTLFDQVKAIEWQGWFKKDVRVVVDKVRTHQSALSSENSIQSISHKAIYSRLGDAWHMSTLPETGDRASVRIYIESNQALVLLDLSGMPLHRRGYRTAGGEAPIRETLAAILLHLMNWRRKIPLHDAFCGSGTIPIEAVLYAYNIAPGLGRRFGLEDLAPYQGENALSLISKEKETAALAIKTDCLVRVTGSDIDQKILLSAQGNAERACSIAGRALQVVGRDSRIPRPDFVQASFSDLAAPFPEGLLLSNPPYGERLGDNDSALALYFSMSSLLDAFQGWDFGFITNNQAFEQAFGRKATKKRPLRSGNLETCLYQYKKE